MKMKKPLQKLVSFSETDTDIANIEKYITEGWKIVSLMPNNFNYLCILEKQVEALDSQDPQDETVYIPPRKKIKIIK